MRGHHEKAHGMAVNQGGQKRSVEELGGPSRPATEFTENQPGETGYENEPGVHPRFLRVINQRRASGRKPGGPAPRRVIEEASAQQIHDQNREDSAEGAERP